ncbi:putative RNA-directed DNA polymerase [Rosa chinensis]|uniref:Putative RNA-directed DNA polymerase n=1 Tax=Rosa chinensis TaxID=74649 RepID=A0A2P6PW61_ROSCH|nr:putative RNA-directed DNA polymerase [Rosa chinensis]
MFWQQKARVKWLQEGDKNSKFFQLTTMVRRRRNKIEGLFDEQGKLCSDAETMRNIAAKYFEDLFAYHRSDDSRFVIPYLFPQLSRSETSWMQRDVTNVEVKTAVFGIGSLKAPGADGYPSIFYQKHWGLCANEVCSFIQSIFSSVLHKFKNSKGRKGFFAWKIDLSKAYDRLNWNFIEHVLYEANFPDSMVKIIMECVTSTSFQVCVNGELSTTFRAGRGLRQGDPLSPYLFVLCMEKLSHLINSAIEVGEWKPVRASGSGPYISHFFFADDLILFSEANTHQASILKQCLEVFCVLSGQTVNFDKSLIFCSPNVGNDLAGDISRLCGSVLTKNMGKYLGMPLIHSRITKHTYASIVDKVQGRLAGWKCNTLSIAGRLTLIQSVTSSIAIYALQTAKLPNSIWSSLDKLNRYFLWGDCNGKKKVHLIRWDMICKPKEFGGLGIKSTTHMNQAMLAKASWRLIQRENGLWSRVLQKKYLKHGNLLTNGYKKPHRCSSTWRSILFGAELVKKGIIWRIGHGNSIKFWTDHWLKNGPLINLARTTENIDFNISVRDSWTNGGWNISFLEQFFEEDIINKILSMPVGFAGGDDDKIIWSGTSNGHFSVKSAYLSLFDEENADFCWKFLWRLCMPPKLKIFFWLIVQGKLLTNAERMKRRSTRDEFCPICHLDWVGWLAANGHCSMKCYGEGFQFPINPTKIIIESATEWFLSQEKKNVVNEQASVALKWLKPANGWVKLNVDGARSNLHGNIGAGGVIRDQFGNWINGFLAHFGHGEVLEAEAWGMRLGLKLAADIGMDKVVVECDSKVLVNLVNNGVDELCPLKTVIDYCLHLQAGFSECIISHVFREVNTVADALSRCNLLLRLVPSTLSNLLHRSLVFC